MSDLMDRVELRIDKTDGCWNWTGGTARGYPSFHNRRVHRFMYQEVVGVIPDGLQLDHLCRNIKCVRPDHLEPVTGAENMRRARLAVCRAGRHDLTIRANQHFDKYGRRRGCYGCLKDRQRKYYHGKKVY